MKLDTRKRKSECTDQEWEQVSAARRESQYTSHRHLGDEANVWLKSRGEESENALRSMMNITTKEDK